MKSLKMENKPCCLSYYELYDIPKTFKIANHEYSVIFKDFVELNEEG